MVFLFLLAFQVVFDGGGKGARLQSRGAKQFAARLNAVVFA